MINYLFHKTELKDVYPHATKWKMFKYWLKYVLLRRFLHVMIVASIAIGLYSAGRYFHPLKVYAEKEVDVSDVKFQEKVELLKDEVVNTLAQCENKGYTANGVQLIWDTNDKASIGPLMFQIDTVIHYFKMKTGETLTKKDAIILALDEIKAKELAKYVLFETPNMAGKDWVNCNKMHKLDDRIRLIKEISK